MSRRPIDQVRRFVNGREEIRCDGCGWRDAESFVKLRSSADKSVRHYRKCDACRRLERVTRVAESIAEVLSGDGSMGRVLIVCKRLSESSNEE